MVYTGRITVDACIPVRSVRKTLRNSRAAKNAAEVTKVRNF